MLVSMALSNSEVWQNLKKSEISELVSVDEHLLRKILNLKSIAPTESIHLEGGGTVPITFLLIQKRIGIISLQEKRVNSLARLIMLRREDCK